jgi:hypothetical protein
MSFRLVLDGSAISSGRAVGVLRIVYRVEIRFGFGGTGVSVSDARGNYVPLGEISRIFSFLPTIFFLYTLFYLLVSKLGIDFF